MKNIRILNGKNEHKKHMNHSEINHSQGKYCSVLQRLKLVG